MNNSDIQRLLDSPENYGTVNLPGGEFEGPFEINKPCTVIGNNTTLWGGTGAILTVKAPGVTLRNLRVEITNDSLPPHKYISIYSTVHDTSFENVEVIGNLAGIAGEEKYWGIPKVLNMGSFSSDKKHIFRFMLDVPVDAELIASFYDVKIYPDKLKAGINTVTIETSPVRTGSYIYGEIFLKSAVTRRIYLSGTADENLTDTHNGTVIFEPSEYNAAGHFTEQDIIAESIIFPEINYNLKNTEKLYSPDNNDEIIIRRGQNINLTCTNAEIDLVCASSDFPMDIDIYAFLLDSYGSVRAKNNFVFFGNDHSACTGVKYLNAPDKRVMFLNLKSIAPDISQTDIAFSIYDAAPDVNFSRLKEPAMRIACDDGKTYIFPLQGKLNEKTLVACEIKRRDNLWVLNPLGMIYRYGINELCGSYGIKVI